MKLQIHGVSDTGRVREMNEDAIAWDSEAGWAVLADGMGGHLAGEVASRLAIDTVAERLSSFREGQAGEEQMNAAVSEANTLIHRRASDSANCRNMGTTLVAGLFRDGTLIAAHVGDSRLYRFRDGMLEQLSHDHSIIQELLDVGLLRAEDASGSEMGHIITRALGLAPEVEVEINAYPVQTGDIYLLCSDGLSDKLGAPEMANMLQDTPLESAAQQMVDEANARGGEDNISVILVHAA